MRMASTVSWVLSFSLMFLLLNQLVFAVDRGNFKTCSQSSFCRRNRNIEEGKTPYYIVSGSAKVEGSKLFANIKSTADDMVDLTLEVVAHLNAVFRVRIIETAPIRPRFELKDILLPTIKEADIQDASSIEEQGVTLKLNKFTALVSYSPFRIDFVNDKDEVVVSLNGNGLMNYERMRTKPEDMSSEPEGAWEETFKTHHDSKPNGPESVGLDISFPASEFVAGIPEHASPLALKPTKGQGINSDPYRLFNLDVFEYELDNPMALYGSIPFMIGHSPSQTVGVFWHNAAETWIDVSTLSEKEGGILSGAWDRLAKLAQFGGSGSKAAVNTHWMSEAGVIDVFVLLGPRPHSVLRQYSQLTGITPLPPRFAISYHQCRWNYNDEADVFGVDQGFEDHQIPYDVLWLDIEHTNGKRYLTWNDKKFPNPVEMQKKLAIRGHKMVTIVDPHIKRDDAYWVHAQATEQGLYVKKADGTTDYEGWCWPGSSSWIDFLRPSTRDWWSDLFATDRYDGSSHSLFIWNDMNEPSVFNGPEITIHKDALHFGNWENRAVHNVYGFYQHMSTAEGLARRSDYTARPFVLSRAFFAGSQRYGAIWTGDNTASWDHLAYSTKMLLSVSIAGLPFAGADVGGFFGNPDAELLTRWYQAAAFQPFFRGHAHLDTRRREPWIFGEPTTGRIRDAIRLRYSYLPLWYTLFYEASIKGSPVMRPLWFEFYDDQDTYNIDDHFLVGRDLLVKPITAPGATETVVYFPGSQPWYDIHTGAKYAVPGKTTVPVTMDRIPVFQHGGSIVPRKMRPRRSSTLMANDPYSLFVAPDNENRASGHLYIDDGESFQYIEGVYLYKQYVYQYPNLSCMTAPTAGVHQKPDLLQTSEWIERIVIAQLPSAPKSILITHENGKKDKLQFSFNDEKRELIIKKPSSNIKENWTIIIQ